MTTLHFVKLLNLIDHFVKLLHLIDHISGVNDGAEAHE